MNTEQKLDKILDAISDIKISQAGMKKDLAWHVYKTEIAEERMQKIEEELRPVAFKVNAISWFLGGAIVLAPVMLKILGAWK